MNQIQNEKLYLCDPEKNKLCDKEECYISGGPCSHTFNKAYEKNQTNQDKLAEMVRTMDPKDIAKFITHTDADFCYKCPASDYCDKHILYSEDGWDRIPDENGEILDCNQIFERWLKEEVK